jgi:uncharacterized membrane protein/sporulation protein YlmC with PRC-barrel domain
MNEYKEEVTMIDIPLNANVECVDGPGGQSSYVIIDPTIEQVTHFVVKENGFHRTERLVPVDWVVETTPDLIHLYCTQDELATLEPFSETHLIWRERPRYDRAWWYGASSYVVPEETAMIRVEYRHIPQGKLVVHRGAGVKATDGRVGRVDEFLADPETGHITHLVLREGHLWAPRDVTIPVSAISRIEEDVVYLNLDKHTIVSLPAVPLSWRKGWKGMYIWETDLIILAFGGQGKADEALSALKRLEKEGIIVGGNAAVLIKDQHSRVFLKETEDVDAKHGALFGAIAGGLIGLVGGLVGVIVGVAAGAVTGGVAARRIDMGFPSAYLKNLQQGLQPGCSAIVALVKHESVEKVTQALAEFQGQLFRRTLTEEVIEWLAAATVAKKGIDKVATY